MSGVIFAKQCSCHSDGIELGLPHVHLFQFSLRSRCTAMLAGLRTLIQTEHRPD
jgi:hypothetical protein